jgi:ketosteroid isomerase-like protein
MRRWVAMILGLAMASGVMAGNLKTLIEAERAFAADSPVRGVKTAFLEVLAMDSLLFRPGPVNGREWFVGRPDEAPFTLEWAPAAAESSGDLGYTFGPFKLTPKDGSEAGGGHFFSIWQADARGQWRLLLDMGIQHELTAFPETVKARGAVNPKADSRAADLEGFDDALNGLRGRAHAAEALLAYYADDTIVLRSGSQPVRRVALSESSPMRGVAQRVMLRVSSDGRLAATAGATSGDAPQAYQRAWRYVDGEGWKVVVDLVGD